MKLILFGYERGRKGHIAKYCHIIIQFIIPIWTLTSDRNLLRSYCLENDGSRVTLEKRKNFFFRAFDVNFDR